MTVGTDVLEIERAAQIEKIKHKVFTNNELLYIEKFENKSEHFAGIFAAKEAVFKCLNLKFLAHQEIEILHNENGKPYVCFYGETLNYFMKNFKSIDISLSHSRTIATSVAVAVKK